MKNNQEIGNVKAESLLLYCFLKNLQKNGSLRVSSARPFNAACTRRAVFIDKPEVFYSFYTSAICERLRLKK